MKYISGEFTATFALTLVVVTAVWVLGVTILAVRHELLGPRAFLRAMPLMVVISFKYTLPMAVLFGASISYGRMSADNEIRAMEWSGIHVGWAIVPAAMVAVGASAVSLAFDCELIPAAERRLSRVLRSTILETIDRQLSRSAQGDIPIVIGYYSVRIGGYDAATKTIRNITVFQTDESRRPILQIDAPGAAIRAGKVLGAIPIVIDENQPESKRRYVTFEFQGGVVKEFDPRSGSMTRQYAAPPVAIDLSADKDRDAGLAGLSSAKLARYSREAEDPGDRLDARVRFFERCALGVSPFFFVLLAAPMASLVRWRHNLTAFLPSLAIVMVIYYPLLMWAKVWAARVDPLYGMFAGNAALLLIAAGTICVLLRR